MLLKVLVYAEVLEYLIDAGYVRLEHYFAGGTKIEAHANKHKMVWDKRKENNHKRVRQQIQDLIQQIEQANAEEQAEYGDEDLEERGGNNSGELNSERLKQRIEELTQRLREQNRPKKETRAERKALKKLSEDCLPRLEKYEQQTQVLAGCSSYSKTDPYAS